MAATFPTFTARSITIKRTPKWSTKIQGSRSGKETRIAWQSRPRYEFQITFESLSVALGEHTTLIAFYNSVYGAWGTFYFLDPQDGTTRLCRFAEDALELERFTAYHWKTSGIKIIEVLS